jgi:hypothetical protein
MKCWLIFIMGVAVIILTSEYSAWCQTFDPYAAAATTSANSSTTTTPSAMTGYTQANTTSSYTTSIANQAGSGAVSSLQSQGMFSLSNTTTNTVSGIFNNTLNNKYVISPQAAFLGSSLSTAQSTTAAAGTLALTGSQVLGAPSNLTQFAVTTGGTTTTTVCDKTSTTSTNATCNWVNSYTYPTCDITQGTISPTACVPAPAGSTPWTTVYTLPGGQVNQFYISMASQCPTSAGFTFAVNTNISGWGPVNFTLPITNQPSMTYTGASMPVSCIWWNYPIDYTGGCSAPVNGIQSCTYNFYARRIQLKYNLLWSTITFYDAGVCNWSYLATGVSYDLYLGSLIFAYQPPGAVLNNNGTDNCGTFSNNTSCKLSQSTCLNSSSQTVNGVSFNPPTGCWDTQNTYSCYQSTDKSACLNLINQGYVQSSTNTGPCVQTDQYGNCLANQFSLNKTTTACIASHTVATNNLTVQGGCASGNTANCVPPPPVPADPSMAQVLTSLMAVHSTTGGLVQPLTNPPMFFQGTGMGCGYDALLGTYNCCSNNTSLINPSCNSTELQLAQNRQNNLCTLVGTYCSSGYDPCQPLGSCFICTQNTETYCCFSSQLADLIQNGAHSQLGISWGTPQAPNCGPLPLS